MRTIWNELSLNACLGRYLRLLRLMTGMITQLIQFESQANLLTQSCLKKFEWSETIAKRIKWHGEHFIELNAKGYVEISS